VQTTASSTTMRSTGRQCACDTAKAPPPPLITRRQLADMLLQAIRGDDPRERGDQQSNARPPWQYTLFNEK